MASPTEVTLLLNLENHPITCILPLSALNMLFSTLLKFLQHLSSVYSKFWYRHAVLPNLPLSRHNQKHTHTHTST
jgi:hypothetical protein